MLYPIRYNAAMNYQIRTTKQFDKWLRSIKNLQTRDRLVQRIANMRLGYFGDHKTIANNLYELRFFFGAGYRVYYTIRENQLILLLCGGDKDTQTKDISLAKRLLNELE